MKIELDIDRVSIDKGGIQDFFWPVSYDEREAFLNQLVSIYMGITTRDEHKEYALPYKFAAKYFINEALSVFSADLLNKRLKEEGITPCYKEEWRLWSGRFNGERPEDPAFIKVLKGGPKAKKAQRKFDLFKKAKRVLSVLKVKKGGLGVGNLKIKPVSTHVLQSDIIATQRTELIQRHAESVNQDVVFCRSERWFSGIDDTEFEAVCGNSSSAIEDQIIIALEKLYRENGLTPEGDILAYFRHVLHVTSRLISIHYQRLLDAPEKLPVNIWTGTGGNIWDALLRHASLHVHDGLVSGHDHGAGLAHVNNPIMALNELWGCKEFVCINENQAREMTRHSERWTFFEENRPKMNGVKVGREVVEFERFSSPDFKVKKVVFLISLSGGDRVWMGPCSGDIVLTDFYARATARLKDWGYDVILKTHPELPAPSQSLIEMSSGCRYEPLEDMIEEADLVLFDHVYTSVFRSVLSTNVPMMLVDFHHHPWTDNALDLLKKRSGFMEGGFDDMNRPFVDWDMLKQGIEDAPNRCRNKEFFEYYYG